MILPGLSKWAPKPRTIVFMRDRRGDTDTKMRPSEDRDGDGSEAQAKGHPGPPEAGRDRKDAPSAPSA